MNVPEFPPLCIFHYCLSGTNNHLVQEFQIAANISYTEDCEQMHLDLAVS
jgi:hypothetical protein